MSRFGHLAPRPEAPRSRPDDLPLQVRAAGKAFEPRPAVLRKSVEAPAPRATALQNVCFAAVCAYLLSIYANDMALHLLRTKAYLSTVCVVILPVLFLATGSMLRGLQHTVGKMWLGFAVWIALSLPFSVWRGGTLSILLDYYPRSYLLFFYICACVISLRQLRWMMNVLAVGSFLLILECVLFGGMDYSGRYAVLGSVFFGNANELGVQLLLNITFLMFGILVSGGEFKKLICFVGICASAFYILKTGSRGDFLALFILALITILFSRRKILFAIVSIPVICILLFTLPTSTLHRLTYIVAGDDAVVSNMADVSALESQMERQHLLMQSIAYSFEYPLFGVGVGQFAVQVAGDTEKKGEHPQWLGTHNSYTQVSSEAGLPAFVFYTLAVMLCIRMNYGLFRRTAARPELREYYAIAFCMFLCVVAYAISTCFDHIAYSCYFPIIGGISVANYLAAQSAMDRMRTA